MGTISNKSNNLDLDGDIANKSYVLDSEGEEIANKSEPDDTSTSVTTTPLPVTTARAKNFKHKILSSESLALITR